MASSSQRTGKFRILFLCTGNSARSILAEHIIRKHGGGRFESFSAGVNPKREVHPTALRILRQVYHLDPAGARSKSWEEFRDQAFDFVITVCDDARERCPVWPGQPIIAHWSSPDPARFQGTDEETYHVFCQVAQQIQRRIELLTCLPFEKLDRLRLEQMTREIGAEASLVPAPAPAAEQAGKA